MKITPLIFIFYVLYHIYISIVKEVAVYNYLGTHFINTHQESYYLRSLASDLKKCNMKIIKVYVKCKYRQNTSYVL